MPHTDRSSTLTLPPMHEIHKIVHFLGGTYNFGLAFFGISSAFLFNSPTLFAKYKGFLVAAGIVYLTLRNHNKSLWNMARSRST